jgi:hypothetical protein
LPTPWQRALYEAAVVLHMDCDALKVSNQMSSADRSSWLQEPSFKVKQTTIQSNN